MAAGLLLTNLLQVQIGWTFRQCQQAYGEPTEHTPPNATRDADVYKFETGDYEITCGLIYEKVVDLTYSRLDDQPLSKREVKLLLEKNSNGMHWSSLELHHGDNGRDSYEYLTVGANRGKGMPASYELKWGTLFISAL